ncbi:hypothetical protein JCM12296A_43320 [Desulfosarcina cetonica]|uniref:1-acyl-sn-glycerol-3-phosphate acyltransferase n=1 Tax=Desulfosarcina cetonica TaxID=90730 RepID=UPI00155D8FEA|nr:1-acyl-sn-glycerol-3-phosphate acyltransferase [Desulfosarcina cetonica]
MGGEQADILKNIPHHAIIVYTVQYKSRFEFLFAHTRYRQLRLPTPQLIFDAGIYLLQPLSRIFRIGLAYLDTLVHRRRIQSPYRSDYYRRALLNSGCAMLYLVEKRGFYRRFVKAQNDPLGYLIKLQNSIDRPIYLVPQLMFFSKNPQPAVPSLMDTVFGTSQRPGMLRKMALLIRYPGKIFTELSQPLNLRQWLAQSAHWEKSIDDQALQLRRQLLLQHNRHRQSITGPTLKSNEELKESILTSDRISRFIAKHAESRQEPIQKIRKMADGYLDEIAARYNPSAIRILSAAVGWIVNAMFDGAVIDKAGLARVKTMSQKGPLILIPCHKSHIDYLILSYVLYNNNMPCPHIAAGKNLSFWPLGPIFRAGGAFFLRRTFKGAVLYARIFSAYIHKLLEEGFNIELFIEGGRSRTGKLLMPKLGMISMLLEAYRKGACEDMIFVPVYIGYDRIIEEQAYIHEVEGGKKEDENLGQVFRARRFLKKRYGKIYINFHTPISTRELTEENGTSLDQMPTKEVNAFCRNLGWRIINAIDKETVITPHGLVAGASLNISRPRFTKAELLDVVGVYLRWAMLQNAKLADTIMLNHTLAMENAIEHYLSRKLLEKAPGDKSRADDQTDFVVNPTKRSLLEFYKNNSISYFVPAAFTALAILRKDAFQFNASDLHNTYTFFQDLFKYEFAFDLDRPAVQYVRKSVKSFIDDAILMPHATIPDCYQITSAGYRKLRLFAAFMRPYLESYKVVLHFLRTHRHEKADAKERLKKIQSLGFQMVKTKEIELIESVSRINYANALSYFSAGGTRDHDADDPRLAHFQAIIENDLARVIP